MNEILNQYCGLLEKAMSECRDEGAKAQCAIAMAEMLKAVVLNKLVDSIDQLVLAVAQAIEKKSK